MATDDDDDDDDDDDLPCFSQDLRTVLIPMAWSKLCGLRTADCAARRWHR